MQNVDQQELKALEKESKQFDAEMKKLCAAGKRDEAQEKAVAYGRKVMQSPSMVTMRECTENMQDALKGMMPTDQYKDLEKEFSEKHVCDM